MARLGFRTGWRVDYPRPMHPITPPENGTNVFLPHLLMNHSGLEACGSSQNRVAQLSVNYLDRLAGQGESYGYNEPQRR